MKLYYLSREEIDGRWQWRVEVAAQQDRFFSLQAHAIEWARTRAQSEWAHAQTEARILLEHEGGEWRQVDAFQHPADPLHVNSRKRPHSNA